MVAVPDPVYFALFIQEVVKRNRGERESEAEERQTDKQTNQTGRHTDRKRDIQTRQTETGRE